MLKYYAEMGARAGPSAGTKKKSAKKAEAGPSAATAPNKLYMRTLPAFTYKAGG